MPASTIAFGSYDLDKYALSDFSYVPVEENTGNWAVSLQSLTFGTEELDKFRQIRIDSSSTLIYISAEAYETVREVACRLVKCDRESSEIAFECEEDMETILPEMTFKMGEQDFPLSPKHYIGRLDQLCYLQLAPTAGDVDILGYPFMRAYYTLFDAEKYQIGFARSINNPLSSSWYIWLGVGLGLLVFAGVIVWFVWCRSNKKTAQSTTDLMEPLIRTNDE
jgi:hypothetical protein